MIDTSLTCHLEKGAFVVTGSFDTYMTEDEMELTGRYPPGYWTGKVHTVSAFNYNDGTGWCVRIEWSHDGNIEITTDSIEESLDGYLDRSDTLRVLQAIRLFVVNELRNAADEMEGGGEITYWHLSIVDTLRELN